MTYPTRTSVANHVSLTTVYAMLILILFSLCSQASAQSKLDLTKIVTLPANTPIRVKIVGAVTSAKIRTGDYVQFKVADDVVVSVPGADDQVVIKKDTIGYGRVVEHKNRRWILKPGRVGVTLEEIAAVDGTMVKVSIARHQNTLAPPALAGLQFLEGESLSEGKREPRRVFCANRTVKDVPPNGFVPCIQGRAYISTFTATLPSSIFTAIASTFVGIRKDPTAKAYAEISLINNLASQSGLASVFNGAYSEFADGEVFDARTLAANSIKVRLSKSVASNGLAIARANAVPPNFIITDYFSDPIRYPGDARRYNGIVIEPIVQHVGETMRICDGQAVPANFAVIDSPYDPFVCPREPGDHTPGPTYKVIMRIS